MSILRFAARSLLASFFIVDGVQTVSDPESRVPSAEKITTAVLPWAERLAPAAVTDCLSAEPKTWVRITGIAQIVGGVGLATGIFRRPSAALLSLTMVPHLLSSRPEKSATGEEHSEDISVFLRDLAVLGGVVLASQDTEGKPGMSWRASEAKRKVAKESRKQKRQLKKASGRAKKKAHKLAEGVVSR